MASKKHHTVELYQNQSIPYARFELVATFSKKGSLVTYSGIDHGVLKAGRTKLIKETSNALYFSVEECGKFVIKNNAACHLDNIYFLKDGTIIEQKTAFFCEFTKL